MRKNGKRKTELIAFLMAVLLTSATGCGSGSEENLVPPNEPHYDAVVPGVTEVIRGNISPRYEGKLTLLDYEAVNYSYSQEEYNELIETYELEVNEVLVDSGDYVKEGDVMISFHSEILDESIRDYQKKKRDAEIEINHLKVLEQIHPDTDYSDMIKKQRRELDAADLHIQDINNTYKSLSVVAKTEGVVVYVNSIVKGGFVKPQTELIRVIKGKGVYTTEKSSDYTFKTGEKHLASDGVNEFEVEVIDTPEGCSDSLVYFKFTDENVKPVEKFMSLSFNMEELKDVCYVKKKAVSSKDDKHFVYIVQDNGFCRAAEVKVGREVDDYIIITDGLAGGEQVRLD